MHHYFEQWNLVCSLSFRSKMSWGEKNLGLLQSQLTCLNIPIAHKSQILVGLSGIFDQ